MDGLQLLQKFVILVKMLFFAVKIKKMIYLVIGNSCLKGQIIGDRADRIGGQPVEVLKMKNMLF